MKPEAILFDAGGTLVLTDWEVLAGVMAASLDFQVVHEAHYRAIAELSGQRDLAEGPVVEWLAWWIGRFLELTGIEPTEEAVERFQEAGIPWSLPIPGAREAVEAVREAGLRVAVVSNSDGKVRDSLAEAGLLDLFEFVLDSHEEGVAKPDPAIFRIALRRLGLPAELVWYVGDSAYHDMEGARAARLGRAVLVDPLGLSPPDQLSVTSLAELPALLDSSA